MLVVTHTTYPSSLGLGLGQRWKQQASQNGDDCDDADPLTYPGAATQDSETDCMTDADQDGFGDDSPENEAITPGSDCDDSDPDINPAAGNCPE